jgi:hypothetical protein
MRRSLGSFAIKRKGHECPFKSACDGLFKRSDRQLGDTSDQSMGRVQTRLSGADVGVVLAISTNSIKK